MSVKKSWYIDTRTCWWNREWLSSDDSIFRRIVDSHPRPRPGHRYTRGGGGPGLWVLGQGQGAQCIANGSGGAGAKEGEGRSFDNASLMCEKIIIVWNRVCVCVQIRTRCTRLGLDTWVKLKVKTSYDIIARHFRWGARRGARNTHTNRHMHWHTHIRARAHIRSLSFRHTRTRE